MIPEKIWAKLREAKISQNTRLSLLATVCSSTKLVNPDQPTLCRGVAIDAYCGENFDIGQAEVYTLMDKFQSFIKAQPESADLDYLIAFPVSAEALPDLHKKSLGEPLPLEVCIPELATILGDSKMRGRANKNKDPDWLQSVPEN